EPLAAACEAGALDPEAARAAFDRAFYAAWLARTTDADPLLRRFHRAEHERRIERFRQLDRELIDATRSLLQARLARAVPDIAGAAAASEVGVLKRELLKKRRHMPLRALFRRIPT